MHRVTRRSDIIAEPDGAKKVSPADAELLPSGECTTEAPGPQTQTGHAAEEYGRLEPALGFFGQVPFLWFSF